MSRNAGSTSIDIKFNQNYDDYFISFTLKGRNSTLSGRFKPAQLSLVVSPQLSFFPFSLKCSIWFGKFEERKYKEKVEEK